MLPVLQREIVEKNQWANEDDILDYFAMGQCLPGIIMVNTSVFIGRHRKGVLGGISAAIGVVLPALTIITVIAMCLNTFADYPAVKNAFAGIRVCVVVLILNAIVSLWPKAVVDKKCIVIFALVCGLSVFTNWSPVVFVIAAALLGIGIKSFEGRHVK